MISSERTSSGVGPNLLHEDKLIFFRPLVRKYRILVMLKFFDYAINELGLQVLLFASTINRFITYFVQEFGIIVS